MSDPNELEVLVDSARLCICGHRKSNHDFPRYPGKCHDLACECEKFEQKIITGTIDFDTHGTRESSEARHLFNIRFEDEPPEQRMSEKVDHPIHYGGKESPYEHIKVCDAWGLNYRLGNATKYICRAGKKSPNAIEDLKKALWYIQSEIERLENEHEQFG